MALFAIIMMDYREGILAWIAHTRSHRLSRNHLKKLPSITPFYIPIRFLFGVVIRRLRCSHLAIGDGQGYAIDISYIGLG